MSYRINEIFYSPQGEGIRAGTPNVFVRFTACNMECRVEPGPKSPGGFDCDTEFASGEKMTLEEIHSAGMALIHPTAPAPSVTRPHEQWQILTGGEPALQVDNEYCDFMHSKGWKLAIETNGSIELPKKANYTARGRTLEFDLEQYPLDWITVSPKVAEHCIRQLHAHEVKYVRAKGQAIPKTKVKALYKLISPAFEPNTIGNIAQLEAETLKHCIELIMRNPDWRLSAQMHKLWRVR